jgi:hypothetical protein
MRIVEPEEARRRRPTLADLLGASLRSVDRVWGDGSQIYVLLPECNRDQGQRALERIAREQPLLHSHTVGLASFPQDGVTSGALLNALAVSSQRAPATFPSADSRLSQEA